jgi:hypothetical protein
MGPSGRLRSWFWLADSDTICVAERPVSEAVFDVFETGDLRYAANMMKVEKRL